MTMDLEGLGRRVAAVQDQRLVSLGAAEKARADFLAQGSFGQPSTVRTFPRSRLVALAAAAALAGAAATFVALGTRERALSFTVGDEPFASVAGRQITSDDRPVPVHFSDGSQVDIEAQSRLVVTAVDRVGAVAELTRGRTSVKVVHRASTRWALRAGPYTVDVVGTRFELEWKPETSRLVVHLDEGRVIVKGGSLASPVPVEAGQILVASDGTWKLTPADIAQGSSPAPQPEPASVAPPTGGAPPTDGTANEGSAPAAPAEVPGAKPAPERPAPSPRWQQLAQAGKYDEALAAAEKNGFETTCRSASASDLMALSEAARLGKSPARARQALVALRERFPGDAQASTAAFYLGRMAGDREAVAWFRTYLREAPGGALRREASGRLLEALSRSGDSQAAAEAAQSYLKQYPHGPHAPLAERILRP